MLELYHFDRSTAAQKVRLSLAEKRLAWTAHYVDPGFATRDQHRPEYLKLNPRGVVPTLVHDGAPIRESQIILEYLEDVFPDPSLRPADARHRAEMRIWTKMVDEWLHVDSRTVGQCIAMRFGSLEADPAVVKQHYEDMPEETRRNNDLINNEQGIESPLLPPAIRHFKKLFHDIDARVSGGRWLAGSDYSLADISMVVYVHRLGSFQMAPLWSELSGLLDWYDRIQARPSWDQAVTKWGDTTSSKRVELGQQAFPRVKEIWDAA